MAAFIKIALVTGGNRGFGFETVRQLAQQGLTVYLGARQLTSAQEAVGKLAAEGLKEVHPI